MQSNRRSCRIRPEVDPRSPAAGTFSSTSNSRPLRSRPRPGYQNPASSPRFAKLTLLGSDFCTISRPASLRRANLIAGNPRTLAHYSTPTYAHLNCAAGGSGSRCSYTAQSTRLAPDRTGWLQKKKTCNGRSGDQLVSSASQPCLCSRVPLAYRISDQARIFLSSSLLPRAASPHRECYPPIQVLSPYPERMRF
jgi:hypothetical protein